MTELHVRIPDEVAERLATEAAERGVTSEDLAAEVLTTHVPPAPAPGVRRFAFIGIGHSGRSDISERAEEILRAEFGA